MLTKAEAPSATCQSLHLTIPESKKSFLIGEKVSLVNQVIEKPIIAYLLFRQC
jgi:hypothetical protein